jgi:hypothetical protein
VARTRSGSSTEARSLGDQPASGALQLPSARTGVTREVVAQAPEDLVQPWVERALRIQAGTCLERTDERFLRQVLRVLRRSDHAEGGVVTPLHIDRYELSERGCLPRLGSTYEDGFGRLASISFALQFRPGSVHGAPIGSLPFTVTRPCRLYSAFAETNLRWSTSTSRTATTPAIAAS